LLRNSSAGGRRIFAQYEIIEESQRQCVIELWSTSGIEVDAYHQTADTWYPTEWEMALFLSTAGVVALKKSQPKIETGHIS
jgi:hypothetical protein